MSDPQDRVRDAKARAMLAEQERLLRLAEQDPERYPGGKVKRRPDRGSELLREKRKRVSGHEGVPHDYPLAVLAARKEISDAQAEAGKMFAGMRAIILGLPFPPAAQWASLVALGIVPEGRPAATLDPVAWEKRYHRTRAAYLRAVDLLDKTGVRGRAEPGEPRATSLVVKVSVFDEAPRQGEVALLRAGLRALAVEWKLEDGR